MIAKEAPNVPAQNRTRAPEMKLGAYAKVIGVVKQMPTAVA